MTTHERFTDDAIGYLQAKGYEIAERGINLNGREVDIIASDADGGYHFITVCGSCDSDEGFPSVNIERVDAEAVFLAYALTTDYEPNTEVTYDCISIVARGSRAVLKHQINCVAA